MKSSRVARDWFCFATVIICVTLIGLTPTAYALPPRPTPTPTGPSTSGPLVPGALIELHVLFSPTQLAHWQELWTVVQWQDRLGNWYDVQGWRGTLDEIVNDTGEKTWWVYRRDLGKGPFRWAVYDRPGGETLAVSPLFDLPRHDSQVTQVQVSLAP